jgi:hypothetical protein
VTKSFSTKKRAACATFSGDPARRTKVLSIARRRASSGKSGGKITGPGNMALTRTCGFRRLSSTANILVIVGIAPLEGK